MSLRSLVGDYRAGRLTRGELAMSLVAIAPELRADDLRSELADRPEALRFLAAWFESIGMGSDMFTSEATTTPSTTARFAARRIAADLSSPHAPARVRSIGFDRFAGPPHVSPAATLGADLDAFHLRTVPR